MEKEDHQQYYLYTALSNTVKDHLAEKNGPHQFWCKRRNCILIHLQKAYRCGLDRSCSSCKYALLWQVSIFFPKGRSLHRRTKKRKTNQAALGIHEKHFSLRAETEYFYTKTRLNCFFRKLSKATKLRLLKEKEGLGMHLVNCKFSEYERCCCQ